MHRLAHLAMSRPGLLAEHAQGYAALLAVEAEAWAAHTRLRLLVTTALLMLLAASLTLACAGIMLWPLYGATLQAHALPLVGAPALPLGGALIAWAWLHSHPQGHAFPALREQLQLDLACLKDDPDGPR
jgi:hypothetical protein